MVLVSIGDLVLDSAGSIGIVINVYGSHFQYKTTAHDGMEFIHEASPGMVVPLGERFKKQYLREMRKLERRHDAEED